MSRLLYTGSSEAFCKKEIDVEPYYFYLYLLISQIQFAKIVFL